jgi:GTP-binding protein LepA
MHRCITSPRSARRWALAFRCGFLGLLHMEIVQERLEREFDQDLITTAPSVVYQVVKGDGEVIMVENPSKMPDQGKMQEIREPIVTVHLYMPQDYVGPVMTLANQKRGVQINMAYHGRQVMLTYEMPLGEIVLDFFDKLKSVSRGYASMDYEFKEYRASDVVKVDILLNGEKVDALSIIVHRTPGAVPRPCRGGQDARDHQPPDVRRGHSGGHRRQHHCARDHQGAAQERAGQVLRR